LFRPQPAVAPPPDITEQQVLQAEQELAGAEAQVEQELQHLSRTATELGDRRSSLLERAAEVQRRHPTEPAVPELQRRLSARQVPLLDLSAQQQAALRARLEAVNARRAALEAMRQGVNTQRAALVRVSTALGEDETALASVEGRMREAAARADQARMEAARAEQMRLEQARQAQVQGQVQLQAAQSRRAAEARTQPETPIRRGPAPVRMQAVVDVDSDSNFFTGFSSRVAEGGLFVATVNHPPLGTEVDLSFTLPDGDRLTVSGVVKWAREVNERTPEIFPGVGVQFTGLEPRAMEQISRFVAAREPMFFPE